jgi:hypothetical protein
VTLPEVKTTVLYFGGNLTRFDESALFWRYAASYRLQPEALIRRG